MTPHPFPLLTAIGIALGWAAFHLTCSRDRVVIVVAVGACVVGWVGK